MTFLITALGVGGAETQLTRTVSALAKRGWRVRVLALRDRPGLAGELIESGVPIRVLTPAGRRPGFGTWRALICALREEPVDCLVTFLLQANVIGRLAGRWCGVRVVSSIRNTRFGGDSRYGARLGDFLELVTMPLAQLVVINARSTANALVARGVVPASKVRIVPNALPPSPPPLSGTAVARARAELGLGRDDFVWITAGRLQAQKNHAVLLEAFACLVREVPRSVLLVAGEGPLADTLRSRTTALGLGASVRWLGLRRDLPDLLRVADAFVLSSRWEGLPNVVMEALAAGLPTVATTVGGIDTLIEDGISGWIAASPTAEDLLSAMRRLTACSPVERALVAATGRDRVLANFSLDSAIDRWERVFHEASGQRGESAA